MSLRARLFLGVVLVNFAAFVALALAVARDVERRNRERAEAERTTREAVVDFGRELFASFLTHLDFASLSLDELLGQPFWEQAADAYITDFVTDLRGTVLSGDIGLNPLGPYDEEAARRRRENFDLLVDAYEQDVVAQRDDLLAVPLFGMRDGRREKWGAAYVQLALPRLPSLPRELDVSVVAAVLAAATFAAVVLVLLLVDWLVLRPLDAVAAGAARVAAGCFEPPVEVPRRGDEIEALVVSFNQMMQEVGQRRSELERRVREVVERMRAAEEQLVLADRLSAMGTLAAGIAHEINNPLGGMLNAVRRLRRRRSGGAETERYLALLEDGLVRIRDLVDRVQRFSRGGAGAGPVPVREVVEDALRFLAHDLRGVDVTVDVPAELLVLADRAALGQVFLNLFANARDALRAHPGAHLAVVGSTLGGEVGVEVRDNGPGMDEPTLRRAFDPFFTTKPAGGGTGLGLTIVHRIVRDLGGRVEIESRPGAGTLVRFTLPAARPAPRGGRP